jgi:hypothetical protein
VTRHNLDVGFPAIWLYCLQAAATAVSSAVVLNCSAMSRRVKSGKNHAAHTHKKHDKKLRKLCKWQKSDDKDGDVSEQSKYSCYHKLASQITHIVVFNENMILELARKLTGRSKRAAQVLSEAEAG